MLSQNKEHLVEICSVLAEQEHLKVTVKEAAKGALMTGVGALFGALLAGPVGLAVGGTVSSVAAAYYGSGKYRSVVDILKNDLTPTQKRRLANSVSNALGNIRQEDYMTLLTLILTSPSLKEKVLAELGTFLYKELHVMIAK